MNWGAKRAGSPRAGHPVRTITEDPELKPTRAVIGLLGGIGAGKSYVARRAAALGPGRLIDADVLAHEALVLYAADGRLAESVGEEFVRDGKPLVKELGHRAFEDPALLRRLERLIHPYCLCAIREAIEAHRSGEGPALLVLEVALLIEVGLDRGCDALWYIEVPDDLRAERAGQRGLTLDQIRLREAFQSPKERKRARADRIIRNDVSDAALDAQIAEGLRDLGVHPRLRDDGTPEGRDPEEGIASPGGTAQEGPTQGGVSQDGQSESSEVGGGATSDPHIGRQTP